MRLHDVEIRLGVAVEVEVLEEIRRLGLDLDLVGNAGLPGEIARSKVQETVAPGDIGVVAVARPVLDAISRHPVPPNAFGRNSGCCVGGCCRYWSRIASDRLRNCR